MYYYLPILIVRVHLRIEMRLGRTPPGKKVGSSQSQPIKRLGSGPDLTAMGFG